MVSVHNSQIESAYGASPAVNICLSWVGVNSIVIMQFEFSHMCDMTAEKCFHACVFRLQHICSSVRMWPSDVQNDSFVHDM